MHWKEGSKNGGEEGETNGSVSCPVCSVHLRKDTTLQDHLNTHPKQDVIEALIQLNDSIKESSTSRKSSFIDPNQVTSAVSSDSLHSATTAASDETHEVQQEVQVASSVIHSAHQVQMSQSPSSGNHFISFPQILGPAPIPQFILPVVAGSNAPPNQSPMMPLLFNPFMFPTGTPSITPQQIEYFAANNMIRGPFQIVQTNAPHHIPMTSTQHVPQLLPLYSHTEGGSSHPGLDVNNSILPDTIESPDPVEAVGTASCPDTEYEDNVENEAKARTDMDANCSSPERESQDYDNVGSPGNHSTCSAEGSLRVRTDLCTASEASCLPVADEDEEEVEVGEPEYEKENSSNEVPVAELPKDEFQTSKLTLSNPPVIFHLSTREPYVPPAASEIPHPSSDISEPQKPVKLPETQSLSANTSAARNEIAGLGAEGLHFLVPSHLFDNSLTSDAKHAQIPEALSPGRPNSPPCDSSPASPYQKSVDSPTVPLNIQTDETMPPRGELSEQESIGGNSSSMWSVPPYQLNRELLSPVVSTSFDLTARESWAGSDISDCEGNANQAPDTSMYKFSSTPSFSNAIPHLLPKPSEGSFLDQKPMLSQNQPQGRGKGKGSNKPPPKPRVYKCKACTLEFACPKERRVHPCEKKKEVKSKAPSTERSLIVMHSVSECNVVVPGSSTEDKDCALTKPKRKYSRKPKATDVKKEIVEVTPAEQSQLTEVRPAVQPQFSEVWTAGQPKFNDVRPVGQTQFGELKPLGQSSCIEVLHNVQQVNVLEVSQPMSQIALREGGVVNCIPQPEFNAEACTQPDMTYVEVTPALLDQKLELNQEYLKKIKSCPECNMIFSNAKDLSRHLTIKHKVHRYQCTTCGENFEKESTYYEHLNIHPLECRICGKCFHRRKSLSLHMKWHMDVKPYKCDSCDKSFVTRQKLDEHHNTHTGNAPLKCPLCDETFKRSSNLIQHKNRHHLNIKRKVKDHICHCGEVYQSKKKLEWHKEIHDNKPKSCPYCSERFVHTSSLTRHVRKAHDKRYVPRAERDGENVECPVCNRVFLKSSLATHIKVHSGARPFSCHICGKDFTTKWNLQHHKWTHASRSSKPFKCTLCNAAFYRKQDYNGHMRSHRNVRPFTCNHCGCQFIRKYNCLRHMKEHEADKKYTCTICNKTFHRGYYLKDHMRVHDGSRPFSCHICGKASTTKSNHNKHVRIHHAREPQNTEI